jgi:hypothetical protein
MAIDQVAAKLGRSVTFVQKALTVAKALTPQAAVMNDNYTARPTTTSFPVPR